MPYLKSLDDLERMRQDVRRARQLRAEISTIIRVGMGTCGIAAGARETMDAIEKELAARQIDAQVVSTGCIGVCVKEPLVDIQQGGKSVVVYANIMPEMVPRLIEEHLIKGQPVREWVVGRMEGQG